MAHNTRKSIRARLISSEDSRVCTICLSGIGETATPSKTCRKREVAILPSCKHMFCVDCITEWSKQTNTCPIDRIKFNLIELWNLRTKVRVNGIRVEDVLDSSLLSAGNDDLTYCEVCGRCDREDVLLLCDGCNKGYHIDCLRPQLDFIPLEVWFCDDCTPNGRAFRWRVNSRSRIRQSSRDSLYENPLLPQFTEITQAASDNSSGTEDATGIRRRRKRYIAPSSPSDSSDGDSEGEAQSLSVSIRRPNFRPSKKPRRKLRKRRRSNRSEELSDVSFSSDVYVTRYTKRLCRKNSLRKRFQVVARPIRRCKLKARENTRKLFRSNSLITSPSSSATTELLNSEHPLTIQAVYTSSDQTDGEASDTSTQRKIPLRNSTRVTPESVSIQSETDPLLSDTDNLTSESDGTLPDREFVPGTDPMHPDTTGSDTEVTANGELTSDQDYEINQCIEDEKKLLGNQPCSSHSDNSNSKSKKLCSRSLRLRPRLASKKVRTSHPRSENKRSIAPRRAKVQAEQILLLQEFFESDDVSD